MLPLAVTHRYSPFGPSLGLLLLALPSVGCTIEGEALSDAGVGDAGPPRVWFDEPNVPTQEDFLAVWGRSANDVWAVGFGGTIVHWNGVSWNLESTTSTQPLTDIHGRPLPDNFDPLDPLAEEPPIFAVGWNGTILQRNRDGTWTDAFTLTPTMSDDLFGVYLGQDDHGIAVGTGGRVMGFSEVVDPATGMMVPGWRTVDFRVPGEFSGELIEPKTTLKGVWSRNGNEYFITGAGGASYVSDNGFNSFAALDTRISEPLRGIWGTGNNNVYAVGLDSLILRFRDGQWQVVRNNGAGILPSVFFFDVMGLGGGDISIAAWRGVMARFQNGEWFTERTDVEIDLRGIWIDRETEIAWAVGASGLILRRDPPPEPDAGMP